VKLNTKNTVILIFFLAAIGYLLYYFLTRVPFDQQKPAVGESAPAIALSDIGGNMVALSDFKGKVVLVTFGQAGALPAKPRCRGSRKYFWILRKGIRCGLPLPLMISLFPLSMELGVSFPVMKINDRVKREYGEVSDVPQSFLIDREGKIIKKVWKVYSENDLRADVERALGVRQ